MRVLSGIFWVLLLLIYVHGEDKECTARLGRIRPCMNFIQGKGETPGTRCCKSVQYVYQHTPVCLCELLSSTGGLASTPGINVTNAITLPSQCNINTNTSACTALLVARSSSSNLDPGLAIAFSVAGLLMVLVQ